MTQTIRAFFKGVETSFRWVFAVPGNYSEIFFLPVIYLALVKMLC